MSSVRVDQKEQKVADQHQIMRVTVVCSIQQKEIAVSQDHDQARYCA